MSQESLEKRMKDLQCQLSFREGYVLSITILGTWIHRAVDDLREKGLITPEGAEILLRICLCAETRDPEELIPGSEPYPQYPGE